MTPVSSRGRTLVLNALTGAIGPTEAVLHDERSRECIESALSEAVSGPTRSELRSLLTDSVDPDTGELTGSMDATDQQFLTSVADQVAGVLSRRGVVVELDHTATVSVDPRNAHLYTFMGTGDTDVLERLGLDAAISDGVMDGANRYAAGEFEDAVSTLEAVAGTHDHPDTVVATLLAGLAAQEGGMNETAKAFITDVLESEPSMWPAKLVGAAADHSSPSLFHEGRLAKRSFVRSQLRPHDESMLSIDVGYAVDGDVHWFDTTGNTHCLVISRLEPDMQLRLQVSGTLDEFPEVQMYYLAAGIVDTAEMVPRSIEHELAGGPVTADACETLRFRHST